MQVLEEMQVLLAYLLKVSGELREYRAFLQVDPACLPAILGTGFYFERQMKHLIS
jgi:hypothetical protein